MYTATCATDDISIHAPLRGATEQLVFQDGTLTIFQSTLPCGERQKVLDRGNVPYQISIHAPLRGATNIQDYMPFY